MIFNTWAYAVFLLTAFLVYWALPTRWRPAALTGFGLYFYWHYYPAHILLISAMSLAVFAVSFVVVPTGSHRTSRAPVFAAAISTCLAVLAFFKYRGFLAELVGAAGASMGWTFEWQPWAIRPPLAISFFTFEFIHYLVEVRKGSFAPARWRDFFLFIMFFPTLVCGPIKRFQQFKPQEYSVQHLQWDDVSSALQRIVFGLGKKTIIADSVAPLCAPVFADPSSYTWGQLWLAVYGYAAQIYFDFSGYSDIAIGSARLFGYRVPENFNYPYLQPNIARFWRNWHMSLTSWITDYVYIPLGGNRGGEGRATWNRFVAMTICGLWHGAALNFLAWGMFHGIALNVFRGFVAVRTRLQLPQLAPRPLGQALATLLTFHVVCVGWVLFVCDLRTAGTIVSRLVLRFE